MAERQIVLIVDDQKINREILKNLLSSEYSTLEASNGQEALDILQSRHGTVSAVLLDIIMPVMDGYAFMEAMKGKALYADIPVIVLTSSSDPEEENRALVKGAWDFITKPYQPLILISRLKNAIARSQMGIFEQMRYQAEHDTLTGLYRRSEFLKKTKTMIAAHPEIEFALIRVDIEQFSLLNAFWGESGGDDFLKKMADGLAEAVKDLPVCTYGRINADVFCVCTPNGHEVLERAIEEAKKTIIGFRSDYYIKPIFGICIIRDRNQPIEEYYERASQASKSCKGKFNRYVAYYDDSMTEASVREQRIISEMQHALETGQFVPYIQPKFDLKTNRPYGGEALVRWQHPERGLVSPGEFIPIFERNGFIGQLDAYMWDQICGVLEKWQKSGLDPAPISVNISRINMYNPSLVSILSGLVKKHGISPQLLNLEITESAYMDHPDIMKDIVRRLQKEGFIVMMDDFGSGYSSLNTLKDIPVDVLKIDMKFLQSDDDTGRSERILSSMIRMAGWLDIPVIVEGVETEHQVEFLKSIGCGFIQGYYFARPMTVSDYEKLVGRFDRGVQQSAVQEAAEEMNKVIWSTDPYIEYLLNHIRQPIAIYEFDGEEAYPLRVNEAFNGFFGYGKNLVSFKTKTPLYTDAKTHAGIRRMFEKAAKEKTTDLLTCLVTDQGGGQHTMQLVVNYLGQVENMAILYTVFNERQDDILPVFEEEAKTDGKLGKSRYSKEEFESLMKVLKAEIPVVRIVEPVTRKVYDIQTLLPTPDVCHDIWGRCSRCDNCTSARALMNRGTAIKLEVLADKTYLVISKYLTVENKDLVLEMVYDATEGMLLEAHRQKEIKEIIDGYNHQLTTDPLMRISNRRYLDENFVPMISCCPDVYERVNVAMTDINHFKEINDRYGHQAGDLLLKDIGSYWKMHFDSRAKGNERIAVRYGGDEVLLIACGIPYSSFRKMVRDYYREMRKTCYIADDVSFTFSLSFGFASSEEHRDGWKWEDILHEADLAMYAEKKRLIKE